MEQRSLVQFRARALQTTEGVELGVGLKEPDEVWLEEPDKAQGPRPKAQGPRSKAQGPRPNKLISRPPKPPNTIMKNNFQPFLSR